MTVAAAGSPPLSQGRASSLDVREAGVAPRCGRSVEPDPSEHDRRPAADYWTAIYRADGARAAVQAADTQLDAALPAARAAAVRARRPAGLDGPAPAGGKASADVTVSFLDLAKVPETETKPASWTAAARARLLPDSFTLLGYIGGQLVINVTGAAVPDSLAISPDPSTPLADQLRSQDGTLHVPDDLLWLTDFDRAVRLGMGFPRPADERAPRRARSADRTRRAGQVHS